MAMLNNQRVSNLHKMYQMIHSYPPQLPSVTRYHKCPILKHAIFLHMFSLQTLWNLFSMNLHVREKT